MNPVKNGGITKALETNRTTATQTAGNVNERKQMEAEDLRAWLRVKNASSATTIQHSYLDKCNEICAYRTDAKNRINKLKSEQRSHLRKLPLKKQVKLVQAILNRKNCNAGSVDGVMGSGTRLAYSKFAQKNNMHITSMTKDNLYFILSALFVDAEGDFRSCD